MAASVRSPWQQLSRNLLCATFFFLEGSDILAKVAVVCKQWQTLSQEENFHRRLMEREFPSLYKVSFSGQSIANLKIIFRKSVIVCHQFANSEIPMTVLWYRMIDKRKADSISRAPLVDKIGKIQNLLECLEKKENQEGTELEPFLAEGSEPKTELFTALSLEELLKSIQRLDEAIRKRKESVKVVEEELPKIGKKRRSCEIL